MNSMKPAPVKGITFFTPPPATVISGLDGNVQITCGDVPLPLLDEDFATMDGEGPTYDMVGRGVYHILRADPGRETALRGHSPYQTNPRVSRFPWMLYDPGTGWTGPVKPVSTRSACATGSGHHRLLSPDFGRPLLLKTSG